MNHQRKPSAPDPICANKNKSNTNGHLIMENIYTFEYPSIGLIRIVVMESEPCRLYLAVSDIATLLPECNLKALKGCLFHNDQTLRTSIIPINEALSLLGNSPIASGKALAIKLNMEVIPEISLLCHSKRS